ncbi:MAG: L-threonylcarbamoyladenylate synthase [Firmicutes bacterium]|nr:L-threonylcarbamoyladenylate synthase [Bacillota bacterium]
MKKIKESKKNNLEKTSAKRMNFDYFQKIVNEEALEGNKKNTKILLPNRNNIKLVANEIFNDGVVAFGTETVYGLGANCFSSKAVEKIFSLKGRPNDNPLICHIYNFLQLKDLASVVPDVAVELAKRFCPGPLTFIFNKKSKVPIITTAGLNTVAVRMPSNKDALKFITACSVPLAAPSANISGTVSPTTATHVFNDFNGKIDYILDTGACDIGLESTVLDVTSDVPKILRTGAISLKDIEEIVGKGKVILATNPVDKPASPGMKYRHYAPKAKVLFASYKSDMHDNINVIYDEAIKDGKSPVILCLEVNSKKYKERQHIIMGNNLNSYANKLYSSLRQADEIGYNVVIAEGVPNIGIGSAIINRLLKASEDTVI